LKQLTSLIQSKVLNDKNIRLIDKEKENEKNNREELINKCFNIYTNQSLLLDKQKKKRKFEEEINDKNFE
jgi:hypothetical protein